MTPIARIAAAFEARRQRAAARRSCAHEIEHLADEDWAGVEYAECLQCHTVSAR